MIGSKMKLVLAFLMLLVFSHNCVAQKTQPKLPDNIKVEKDIEFHIVDGISLKLDLYKPLTAKASLPVIVWVHGGGWQKGSKDRCPITWLCDHGFAVASVDYRLTDQAAWPSQLNDCRAAVAFLKTHQNRLGLNANRVGVSGSSAGGHLAAAMGTVDQTEAERSASGVVAVCDYYGPTDLLTMPNNVAKNKADEELAITPGGKLVGGAVLKNEEVAKSASPFYQASRGDAPTLIIHGTTDLLVPLEQSQRFHKILLAKGCESTLHIVPDVGHSIKLYQTTEIHKLVAGFFKRHVVEESGSPQTSSANTLANGLGTLVFEDDFDRNESQEDRDEVGNGWKTDGEKPWSKGPKQADLAGGVLHAKPADGKKSDLLVIRPAQFQNGSLEFRFLLKNESDNIGMVIADSGLKNVHAGHVISFRMLRGKVLLSDMLSGAFDPEIWKRKKAGKTTAEDKKQVKACKKSFNAPIKVGVWHTSRLTVEGDQATVSIDGNLVGQFTSPGFANPKTTLRISFKQSGAVDDFKFWRND